MSSHPGVPTVVLVLAQKAPIKGDPPVPGQPGWLITLSSTCPLSFPRWTKPQPARSPGAQKSPDTARPRLPARACRPGWPSTGVWKRGCETAPYTDNNFPATVRVAPHAQTGQVVRCADTCFPSESLEFWYTLGRGCLQDQPLMKPLDAESLNELPW